MAMLIVAAAIALSQVASGPPPRLNLEVPALTAPLPMAIKHDVRRPGQTLFALSAVAHSLDLGTTYLAHRAGYTETNPIMRGPIKHPATAIAAKAGGVVALEMIARYTEQRTHRRAGTALRVFAIAAGTVPAVLNARLASRPRK